MRKERYLLYYLVGFFIIVFAIFLPFTKIVSGVFFTLGLLVMAVTFIIDYLNRDNWM